MIMTYKSYRHFQVGDIVRCRDIWGDILFIIHSFSGNRYCPIAHTHFKGEDMKNLSNRCDLNENLLELVDFSPRPLEKIKDSVLQKLVAKGNENAIRELLIRKPK